MHHATGASVDCVIAVLRLFQLVIIRHHLIASFRDCSDCIDHELRGNPSIRAHRWQGEHTVGKCARCTAHAYGTKVPPTL